MIVFWPCRVCSSASRVAGFLAGSQMSLNSFNSLGTRCLQTSGAGFLDSGVLSKSLIGTHSAHMCSNRRWPPKCAAGMATQFMPSVSAACCWQTVCQLAVNCMQTSHPQGSAVR